MSNHNARTYLSQTAELPYGMMQNPRFKGVVYDTSLIRPDDVEPGAEVYDLRNFSTISASAYRNVTSSSVTIPWPEFAIIGSTDIKYMQNGPGRWYVGGSPATAAGTSAKAYLLVYNAETGAYLWVNGQNLFDSQKYRFINSSLCMIAKGSNFVVFGLMAYGSDSAEESTTYSFAFEFSVSGTTINQVNLARSSVVFPKYDTYTFYAPASVYTADDGAIVYCHSGGVSVYKDGALTGYPSSTGVNILFCAKQVTPGTSSDYGTFYFPYSTGLYEFNTATSSSTLVSGMSSPKLVHVNYDDLMGAGGDWFYDNALLRGLDQDGNIDLGVSDHIFLGFTQSAMFFNKTKNYLTQNYASSATSSALYLPDLKQKMVCWGNFPKTRFFCENTGLISFNLRERELGSYT